MGQAVANSSQAANHCALLNASQMSEYGVAVGDDTMQSQALHPGERLGFVSSWCMDGS